ISFERRDHGVLLATLNRPKKLNAVNATMHHELSRFAYEFDGDPTMTVMVVTGAGRAFCAGGDFTDDPIGVDNSAMMLEGRRIVDHILECRKPLISAVNGYAMGLGATVALLCDVVFAGRKAVFADTHVNMGLGAGDGGQVIWPLLMSVNRAKYYLMTGDQIDAVEADRLGLVNFVVDDDDLLPKALELAERLASGPLQAAMASKVPINHWMRARSAQILPYSIQMEEANAQSAMSAAAREAFTRRRQAQ
ncbi:MAG: enoyl-CoA hydratase-related protein, partial [Ilumatobacteraceae bacterium]